MEKLEALRTYFGHAGFRPGQEQVVDAILSGRDALAVMPTGGGKSVCYQLPALLLRGVTLVISPLISLMKDQVTALGAMGVRAAYINSSLTAEQRHLVYRNLRQGQYKLVYIAPERLDMDGFVALARELPIGLVAVDEAHCISQWGQDFRPSYLRIPDFLEKLPRRPVLAAFTATATDRVRLDICQALGLRRPLSVTTGFDRPNLYFDVLRPADKLHTLLELVTQRQERCGIVYCATRAGVEKTCAALQARGIAATRYHAGLDDEERRRSQEDFLFDRAAVMVATNAFGMGIDKSNVSYVIHMNMPQSLEAYYQEAGRAGRDGSEAECILLFSPADIRTAKYLIRNGGDSSELPDAERRAVIARDLRLLDTMVGYCKTDGCLRGYILDYFGQDHPGHCGRCGNCCASYARTDMTRQAQMILSCVLRMKARMGYTGGAVLLAQVLSGSADRRVRALGLDRLSTYGLMRGVSQSRIRGYIERLEQLGYLRTDPQHGGIDATEQAGDVLFRGKTVYYLQRTETEQKQAAAPATRPPAGAPDAGLYEALRALRARLARTEHVPPYVIFSNATLTDMAARAPRSTEQLLQVSGVGQVKAARYGEAFLAAIADYLDK